MEEKKPRRSYSAYFLLAIILLPFLYVLSIGPAYWILFRMENTPWIESTGAVFNMIYSPLNFLCEKIEGFEQFMHWYIDLFVP